jgi:lipopolysaccharide export system permease protein
MILHRYFARRFLKTFLGITGIFFMMILFIDLVDQLRRFGRSDAAFRELLVLTLFNLPAAVYQIMPLILILASIALFLGLARSSEMVVTRAAGRSALRALTGPLVVALIIGVVSVAVFNPIVAGTTKQSEARVDALRGNTSVLSIGSTGLWLRQGSDVSQTVIRAQSANLDGTELRDVTFLTYTIEGDPIRRIEAARAVLQPGSWELTQAKLWPLSDAAIPEAEASYHDVFQIPSTLTVDEIRNSFGAPSSIPIWELPAFIERLQRAGLSAQRHLVWFHSELALPVFLLSMVMIGASFTLRHQRGGRTGLMVLFAIVLAFVVYFIRNFAMVLGENGQLPAILAAWAPPVAAIGLSLGFLLHNEDG